MTGRERLLAAIRCQEVDYAPLSMEFWPEPRHPRATWQDERGRLAAYRAWEWDTTVGYHTAVTPSRAVRVEVRYENDGTVIHQTWHTPAGNLSECLRVTEDWAAARNAPSYLPIMDDFRAPRYLEPLLKDVDDLARLQYLFPEENPADTETMEREHAVARALADEHSLALSVYHSAGLDYLTWLFGAQGAVMAALDHRPLVDGVLRIVNAAYAQRLRTALGLGIDMVERRGWYETTDFWSPSLYEQLARPIVAPEIEETHRAGAAHVYLMDTGVVPLLPLLAGLPFDCLHGVEPAYTRLDQRELRRQLPGKSIWGGISGPENLGRGTPASVERAVESAFRDYGSVGFILGMAVGIRSTWPEANLAACERAWRRMRARRLPAASDGMRPVS